MSNEGYHEPAAALTDATRDMHRVVVSRREEVAVEIENAALPEPLEQPSRLDEKCRRVRLKPRAQTARPRLHCPARHAPRRPPRAATRGV